MCFSQVQSNVLDFVTPKLIQYNIMLNWGKARILHFMGMQIVFFAIFAWMTLDY